MTTQQDIPKIMSMCNTILENCDEVERMKPEPDQLFEHTRTKIIARNVRVYARGVMQLCEEIMTGARDTSLDTAFKSIDGFLAEINKLVKTFKRE
jgi:hypothetical protein